MNAYDHYTPTKKEELLGFSSDLDDLFATIAAENSTLLSEEITRMAISGEINPNDPVAVGTFVRTKLDPFVDGVQHILCDLKTYYYWRLDDLFQAIPREPLLASDERLEFYRDEIKRIVGHI
jgi:hypothetical protein